MSTTLPGSTSPVADKLAVALTPVLDRVALEDGQRQSLQGCADVAAALDRLTGPDDLVSAVTLVAHALPKREAVWWACMCARAVPAAQAAPIDVAALDAAEFWVRKPDDERRRACMAAAQAGRFDSPEAWAAVGAFWSGGSMSPPDAPAVAPPEHLTALAVAGAVRLAALRRKPAAVNQRLVRFLAAAREIATGGAGRMPPDAP